MNLPANVSAVKDRHGKVRYRFRKPGLASRYVQGEPGTEQFARSYENCFDASYRPPLRQKPELWVRSSLRPLTGHSVVYFLGSGPGPVKIGTTVNLAARLKKLQTGHPKKLRVLAYVAGGPELEAHYHSRFADCLVHGEWFQGHAVRAEIRRLRRARIVQPSTPETKVGQKTRHNQQHLQGVG